MAGEHEDAERTLFKRAITTADAVTAERERCAKIAEAHAEAVTATGEDGEAYIALAIARAIRAQTKG